MLALQASAFALSMPDRPTGRVNDYAQILSSADAADLERNLKQFEEQTSNQIVIAIFPSLDDEDLNDFTNRLFEKWRLGQKQHNNGVLLAAFMAEHKVRIEVGYGLEGALTDALSSEIIRNDIVPAFRSERYADGLRAAVQDIEKVIRGEYKGRGQPAVEPIQNYAPLILFAAFMLFSIWMRARRRRGIFFPPGRSGCFPLIFFPPGPTGRRRDNDDWFSGGGWGGGSGGGGGFSGGGGISGGGGASGSW